MANTSTRDKLAKIGSKQKAALRAAILEMRREGVELTRDRLRDRAGVDNNAATVVLAAYRQGAFEVPDELPPQAATGAGSARPARPGERILVLGPRAIADLEAERYPFPVDVDDAFDPTGLELSVMSHMSALLNPRRKRAVLRFAQLMLEAEARQLAELDGQDEATALGLDPASLEPPEGEADVGLCALERLGADDLGPWEAACRAEEPKGTKRSR